MYEQIKQEQEDYQKKCEHVPVKRVIDREGLFLFGHKIPFSDRFFGQKFTIHSIGFTELREVKCKKCAREGYILDDEYFWI